MENRFIPAPLSLIIEHLEEEFFFEPEERRRFHELSRLIESISAHFTRQRNEALRKLYRLFDPDCEAHVTGVSAREAVRIDELFELLHLALHDSGFERMTDETFAEAAKDTKTVTSFAVRLNLPKIERFALYHRGVGHKAQVVRPIKKLFQRVELEIPTYTRVVVITRSFDEPYITLHLYKDVAQDDVELLLPTIDIRMKLVDTLKIGGASGSAFVSAIKLLRTMFVSVPKFVALPFKVILLPLILVVTIIYGGKAFLDYSKVRQQYLEALREHLYNLGIARNDGVLSIAGDWATEERAKRQLLSFAFLYKSGRGLEAEELKTQVNRFVKRAFVAEVAFDAELALEELAELGLLRQAEAGRNQVLGLREALETVDHIWDELYEPPSRSGSFQS